MKTDKISFKLFPPYIAYHSLTSHYGVISCIIKEDNKRLKEYLKANFVLSKEQLDYILKEVEIDFKGKRNIDKNTLF